MGLVIDEIIANDKKGRLDEDSVCVSILEKEEICDTRAIWEEIFHEDTKELLDYYYTEITKDNEVYVIRNQKEEIISMIHLNPYEMYMNGTLGVAHYIVAVSTKEQYRGRGLMRHLLMRSFREMYRKNEAFTYLMPIAEAIYIPYDFVTIYEQPHYMYKGEGRFYDYLKKFTDCHTAMLEGEKGGITGISVEKIEGNYAELAAFAREYLESKYTIFTEHTEGYLGRMDKEVKSLNGEIILFRNTDNSELVGYCYTGKEGDEYVREIVMKDSSQKLNGLFETLMEKQVLVKKNSTKIMARPVHLERFLEQCVVSMDEFCLDMGLGKCAEELSISVQDNFIEENCGTYQVVNYDGTMRWSKVSEEVIGKPYTIEELTERVFQRGRVFLNEIL